MRKLVLAINQLFLTPNRARLHAILRTVQASGVQNLRTDRPERTTVEIRKRNNVHVIDAIRPGRPRARLCARLWV